MSNLLPPVYLFALATMHLGVPWLLFCLYEARKGRGMGLLLQSGVFVVFVLGALDVYELVPALWWGDDVAIEMASATLWLCAVLLVSIAARLDVVALLRKKDSTP